ncbi:uncharacterized protein LOC111404364 [Olea europaea var. sylvestris]|uniref:uncharacterized protein LOC111404364 n=1 Tax=Olea europaea var. sylvestris TaxID=158386 RepID=UPI000C1CF3C4|nr:uncharacterized protein LOC111404364 [Olea europaea var. sylvestris]
MEETLNPKRIGLPQEMVEHKRYEFKWPPRIKSPLDAKDRNKYCNFHKDHGHTTENCMALQREIEALIKRRLLSSYVSSDKRPRNGRNKEKAPATRAWSPTNRGTINIIVGSIASRRDSNNGRKQYARQHSLTSGIS